jgi:hypothetical protein
VLYEPARHVVLLHGALVVEGLLRVGALQEQLELWQVLLLQLVKAVAALARDAVQGEG